MIEKKESVKSTWRQPLPADEIGRQQAALDRLSPGSEVELRDMGRFVYSGIWDTMHAFYPAAGQSRELLEAAVTSRYVRRDMRGGLFVQLPYTLLADYVL